MSKYNTILFDFDGTIMDTNNVILQSWQHTFRQLAGKEAEEKMLIKTFGEPLSDTMGRFFGGSIEDIERNIEIYRSFQREHFSDFISPFPGMKDAIEQLKNQGKKLAVVTSRLKNTTIEGMDKFGLTPYFDYVVTAEDVTKHKPDPQPILTALDYLNADPGEAVMIGDTWMDVLCAKNAGVLSVLVSWSLAFPKEDITLENAPDIYLEKIDDLFTLL